MLSRKLLSAVLGSGLLLLLPASGAAQSIIAGQVTDNTGGVLPGVTVEAASPALIEGSRVAITDGSGLYTLIDMRPGVYTVTFTLPGFGTQVRDQLALQADVTMNLDVAMSVGGIEETVTVSGEAPVVDVQQVQRVEVLTRETQEAIPTGRSLWSYALLIPGVKVHKPDVGGTAGAQQSTMYGRGLGRRHTTIEIDGVQVNTMIDDGAFNAYLNPMMTAETSYTTTGANAETQAGGLRINMIPAEGGNNFSGTLFAGFVPGTLQANNFNHRLGGLGVKKEGIPKVDRLYDYNAAVGGPIIRDKLWFFSSARRNIQNAGIVNSIKYDGTPGIDDNSITSGMTRLTWQITQNNKFGIFYDKVRKRRFHTHAFGWDPDTASYYQGSPHYNTGQAKWTSTLSSRLLAEFGYSLVYEDWDLAYQGNQNEQPDQRAIGFDVPTLEQVVPTDNMAFCYTTPCFPPIGSPRHMAQMHPSLGGDPWYSVVQRRDSWMDWRYTAIDRAAWHYTHRWSYAGSISYVTGSHNLKIGTNITRGQNRFSRQGNGHGYNLYTDAPHPLGRTIDLGVAGCDHPAAESNVVAGLPCGTIGTPNKFVALNNPTLWAANLDYNGGVYVQDSWTIDRLTLNYGLRMDFASAHVPAVPHPPGRFVGAFAYPERAAGDVLPKFGPDWAPRLSVAYDLFGDARTALKASWNRYVRPTGGNYPGRYGIAAEFRDERDWFDIALDPATGGLPAGCTVSSPAACPDPYGSNMDDIAQNWEIGASSSESFGFRSPNTPDPDLQREYNDIWTIGMQQEIVTGFSVSAEYRQRKFYDSWSPDNLAWNFVDFGALPDGTADPNAMCRPGYSGGCWFEMLRPYPFAGSVTVFNIDPSLRDVDNYVDRTRGPGYSNVYNGFELSAQARLANGGTIFGGWSVEDNGRVTIYDYDEGSGAGSRYGGEVNDCQDILDQGDDPNRLRFCDRGAYPRPYRHEFKLSGTFPFSAGPLGDWQVAGSFQAYPGGNQDWSGLQEGFFIHRTSSNELISTYSDQFYGQAGHCVDPCSLGANIVPAGAQTVNISTSEGWFPLIPLNTVKFEPYWTQVDVNLQKLFNIGNWQYDARIEFFNAFNYGIEVWHSGSRNGRGSTGAGYQSLSNWERAEKLLEGRVIRFAVTARF